MDNKQHQKQHTDRFKQQGGRIVAVRLPHSLVLKLDDLCDKWQLSQNAAIKKLLSLIVIK